MNSADPKAADQGIGHSLTAGDTDRLAGDDRPDQDVRLPTVTYIIRSLPKSASKHSLFSLANTFTPSR